jgi:hypothetical protein
VFAKLSAAYEILSDDTQRRLYDKEFQQNTTKKSSSAKAVPTSPRKASSSTSGPSKGKPEGARRYQHTPSSPKKTTTPKGSAFGGPPSTPNSAAKHKPAESPTAKKSPHQEHPLTGNSNKNLRTHKKEWKPMDENVRWESAIISNELVCKSGSHQQQQQSHLKGYKFHDPYDVFRKVFREEFGEEFVPGERPKASAAVPPKPSDARALMTTKKQKQPTQKAKNDVDNRALCGRTKTKQIVHDDGRLETVTTTIITRPNGEEERVTKSTFEKLSKEEQEKWNTARKLKSTPKKNMLMLMPSDPPKPKLLM